MYLRNFLICLILCATQCYASQIYRGDKFKTWSTSFKTPHRILELMRSYYEEANVRIASMNHMRFMYEESPYYEQGYIISEIIERYRKLVEHAKRPIQYLSDTVLDTLKRVEIGQTLYFELYHLVRMMHETPRKWRYDPEFMAKGPNGSTGLEELYEAQMNILKMEQRRERERRKRKKMYAKLRQQYLKGLSKEYSGKKKGRYNRHWPLDYGWEVDFTW